MRTHGSKGESVAEYAVVLALIAMIVTAVLLSIGHGSHDRFASINAATAGSTVDAGNSTAASSGAHGRGPATANSGNNSGSGQPSGNNVAAGD